MTFTATATPRSAWRRLRLPLALLALVVVASLFIALLQGTSSGSDLDPTSYTQGGSRAIATLLAERGAPVTRVDAVPGGGDGEASVVVPDSGLLNGEALASLLTLAADVPVVVVVTDDGTSDDALHISSDDSGSAAPDGIPDDTASHDPHCALAAAVTADESQTGSRNFDTGTIPAGFQVENSCYDGTLLALQPVSGTGSLTLLGSPALLTNHYLDRGGNAALALSLIDHGGPVSWLQPHPGTSAAANGDDGSSTVLDLLPHRLKVAAWELALVGLLLGLWRVRRLGPVVVEQLPVNVRSAETVRGRARLYRSSDARDRAALALREATRARLATGLGLGPQTRPEALVAAVAERSGRSATEAGSLLYGAIPTDDKALVALADDLDTLVREAKR